jgi:Zn-dependent protease with chaperone function
MFSILTFHSDSHPLKVTGLFYDGVTSRAWPVEILLQEGQCMISGAGIDRTFPFANVKISEPFDGAHRMLQFPDGSSCEIPDSSELHLLLKAAGHKQSLVVRIQKKWRWVAFSFMLLIALIAAAYVWVLPVAAEKIAYQLPDVALSLISQQALASLDKKLLGPSVLPAERQQQLQERFARVAFPPGDFVAAKVTFRSSTFGGANAFALPDGTLVFFDKLVKLAANDDELVAVFAHEAGHAAHRHGVRQMIQGSIVALTLAAYIGDVSTLAGALSGWLLEARYSRDFERDADRYASAVLKENNISPVLLGSFLVKIEADQKKRKGKGDEESGGKMFDYLSSHPDTKERMKALERY